MKSRREKITLSYFYGEIHMEIRARPKGLIFILKTEKKERKTAWKQSYHPASQQQLHS